MGLKKNKWLQPFYFLDGNKALLLGLIFMFLTGYWSYLIGFRHDGFIDYHGYAALPSYYIFDVFIPWLLISILTGVIGLCYKKAFRWIDVLGMYALAFAPLLLYPCITVLTDGKAIADLVTEELTVPELLAQMKPYTVQLAISSIVQLATVVWLIYWCYLVFQLNLNLKQPNSKVLFAIVCVVVEILAVLIIRSY